MLDETSPYIAGWFAVTVLTLMLLKYVYLGQGLDEQGEAEVGMIKSTVSSISNPILITLDTTISVILDIMLNNEHPNGPNSCLGRVPIRAVLGEAFHHFGHRSLLLCHPRLCLRSQV